MVVLAFYLLLTIAFLAEGLGIRNGREIAYVAILIIPALLFLNQGKKIEMPKYFVILSVLFFGFSILSVFFSVDTKASIGYLIFYATCFLSFIFAYNNQEQIKKYLLGFILALGIVFCIYSTFLNSGAFDRIGLLQPYHGFQYISSDFASHSQLGNFLVLPILICLYFIFSKKKIVYSILLLIFFLPYFVLSYSRSAYLALGILSVIFTIYEFLKRENKTLSWVGAFTGLFLLALSINFAFITLKDKPLPSFLENTRTVLVNKHALPSKYILSARDEYLSQSLKSILEKPILGVGPGNFHHASIKHTKISKIWTNSSHNIFIDILVENGIPAGIVFLTLIVILLWRSERNIYFYLLLSTLLVFQTDYSFRAYSFTLLLIILLGASCRNSKYSADYIKL